MIPRRVRYKCPKCKKRESHTEGCVMMPRICSKCHTPLIPIETNLGSNPNPKEILDMIFNIFK